MGNFNIKLGARQCNICLISSSESNKFLNKYHIQGEDTSKIRIGLKNKQNELVALMTFKKSRFNKNYQWELIRYSTKSEYLVQGGASKLLNYFVKNYNPDSIITYADRSWSIGNMYNKIGFTHLKNTIPGYFYVKDDLILSR